MQQTSHLKLMQTGFVLSSFMLTTPTTWQMAESHSGFGMRQCTSNSKELLTVRPAGRRLKHALRSLSPSWCTAALHRGGFKALRSRQQRAVCRDHVITSGVAVWRRRFEKKVDHALQALSIRPRNILRYRFGLHKNVDNPLSLTEVAELYGLKSDRVRQIEMLALAVLQSSVEGDVKNSRRRMPLELADDTASDFPALGQPQPYGHSYDVI